MLSRNIAQEQNQVRPLQNMDQATQEDNTVFLHRHGPSQPVQMARKDWMEVAKACFFIIYLRLSFRGLEICLPLPDIHRFAQKELSHDPRPVTIKNERAPSLPVFGQLATHQASIPPLQPFLAHVDDDPYLAKVDESCLIQRDAHAVATSMTPDYPPHRVDSVVTTRERVPYRSGHEYGDVKVSGQAIAQMGDSYHTYNVDSMNMYKQFDMVRVGMVAGTTAAMMSNLLSACRSFLQVEKTKDFNTSQVDLFTKVDLSTKFITHIAEAVSLAVTKTWVREYQEMDRTHASAVSHNVEPPDNEAKVEMLRSIVPIVGVDKAQRCAIDQNRTCGPLSEVIRLLRKRANVSYSPLLSAGLEAARSCRDNPKRLDILAFSGILLLATATTSMLRPTRYCPIIYDFAANEDVCCIVLHDDYFEAGSYDLRTALIVFKSRQLAKTAMEKWEGDHRAPIRAPSGSTKTKHHRCANCYHLETTTPSTVASMKRLQRIFFLPESDGRKSKVDRSKKGGSQDRHGGRSRDDWTWSQDGRDTHTTSMYGRTTRDKVEYLEDRTQAREERRPVVPKQDPIERGERYRPPRRAKLGRDLSPPGFDGSLLRTDPRPGIGAEVWK